MSLKRIKNEVARCFPSAMKALDLSYKLCYIDSETMLKQLVICNDYGRVVLKINCGDHYPFRSPAVFVNTSLSSSSEANFMSYSYWAKDIIRSNSSINYVNAWAFTNILYPQLKCAWNFVPHNNLKNICLCCQSATCSNNWGPHILIADIFLEYFVRRKFMLFCSPLMQRYINAIFDNDRWCVPDDLIIDIVSKI